MVSTLRNFRATERGRAKGPRVTGTARGTGRIAAIGGGLVGYLVFVEFTSGVLQGYYIPLLTDVARHLGIHDADVNWLEAAQLMLSAIAVPILAKLGDLHGHRRMLLVSAAVAAASTGLIVAALELGAIVGALGGGQVGSVLAEQFWLVLLVPGILVLGV